MKRNFGIDLLRIVAMMFVIVLHLVGVGGICAQAPLLGGNFLVTQFLRTATFCAVNVYALISGFVGWNRGAKLSGLLILWLKVICFCVGITLFTKLRAPDTVGWADLKRAFTPVLDGKYWYFSSYVGMFFFTPVLNHAARSISGREAMLTMGGITMLVLSLPYSKLTNNFLLANGYSVLWLVILYLGGALLGRFRIPEKAKTWHWAVLYLLAVLANHVPRMVLLWLKPEYWTPSNQNLMVQYTSPTIILSAVALMCLFARLELKKPMVRAVSKLSPHAFGVYLFHTHTLVFLTAVRGRFAYLGTAPLYELLGTLLSATAVIYILGTVLDWALTRLMQLVRVDRLLKKLDVFF